jgi:hypothetical protein
MIERAPLVPAGAPFTLKVKVSCPPGCDLIGIPIQIAAADGAPIRSEFASQRGRDDITEVKRQAEWANTAGV